MLGYVAVNLYRERIGKVVRFRISTGDGVIGFVAVDLYSGRCGRDWGEISLLETVW